MNLATDIKDPLARLMKIHADSASTKLMMGRFKSVMPTDFPLPAAPWLMSAVASLFSRSRLANVMPPLANLVISNVAGIPVQLYFAGAKVVSYYPVSIPAHSMALNVTVQSYNGRLDYGLIACRRAVPDVNDLADGLLAEHRVLLELARAQLADPVEALLHPAKAKAEKPTVLLQNTTPSPAAKPPGAKNPATRKRAKRAAVAA